MTTGLSGNRPIFATTNSRSPIGGCISPIIRFSTMTDPNWIGSMPSWAPSGSSVGTKMIIAGNGSRMQPTNSRNTLIVISMMVGSEEIVRIR